MPIGRAPVRPLVRAGKASVRCAANFPARLRRKRGSPSDAAFGPRSEDTGQKAPAGTAQGGALPPRFERRGEEPAPPTRDDIVDVRNAQRDMVLDTL